MTISGVSSVESGATFMNGRFILFSSYQVEGSNTFVEFGETESLMFCDCLIVIPEQVRDAEEHILTLPSPPVMGS